MTKLPKKIYKVKIIFVIVASQVTTIASQVTTIASQTTIIPKKFALI